MLEGEFIFARQILGLVMMATAQKASRSYGRAFKRRERGYWDDIAIQKRFFDKLGETLRLKSILIHINITSRIDIMGQRWMIGIVLPLHKCMSMAAVVCYTASTMTT